MTLSTLKRLLSPKWDPWDPLNTKSSLGEYRLTSVEFTVTNLCNLRCEHCAVGDVLTHREAPHLPVDLFLKKLDELEDLTTISITGGEPAVNPMISREVILPLLKYAHDRDLYTQVNSNLTLPLSNYESWINYVDVMHISCNYRDEQDFHNIVFGKANKQVNIKHSYELYQRMINNARELSSNNIFVSAESLLSKLTIQFLPKLHNAIVEMGCKRHEIHPLYQSDFARNLDVISLDEYREGINSLIQHRDPNIWILLGTVPIFPCSDKLHERQFWYNLQSLHNLTVRQDPDGRNRVNVNIFTGNVSVSDFVDASNFGDIKTSRLDDLFNKWISSKEARQFHCYCPSAGCLGPNSLVADSYYRDWDFSSRKAY